MGDDKSSLLLIASFGLLYHHRTDDTCFEFNLPLVLKSIFTRYILSVQTSTAGKVYESVLSTSLAANKAATKKAEMLTQELGLLQIKYDRAVKEGSEQEEIIVMLQQQRQEGT